METKFTKGKWNACCLDDIPHFVFAGEKTICAMKINERGKRNYEPMEATVTVSECVANAKLIQAAPEMLEACLVAKAMYEAQGINETSKIGGEQYRNLLDALKKATE